MRIPGGVQRCIPTLVAVVIVLSGSSLPLAASPASVGAALRVALAAPADACGLSGLDARELTRFYPRTDPFWVDERGPRAQAGQLRTVLVHAEDEGLSPDRYAIAGIDARWTATGPAELACLDLLLTAAFARYGRDVATGRAAPGEADRTWHLRPATFDPVAALRAMPPDANLVVYLEALAPAHGLYRRLRTALARYRRLAGDGGWDTALSGPTLGPGDEDDRVAMLRTRLLREGDLDPDAAAAAPDRRHDARLADAVRRFQRRHGLLVDGVVGPQTLAALDTPVAERIAQLRRAMDRLRWMPHDPGRHYVVVNTAGFELAVIEDDRVVLGMRTIVGTLDQGTPSFTAMLRSLVINPYWNVPVRIVRDRLLPLERRSPGYLASRGFRVFDDGANAWREPDAQALASAQRSAPGGVPRLRQEPGPINLMGRLSFVFPNPFDVFLHDTPDRSLFERVVRACSEGCVRIEHAMTLALHVLRRMPEWTEERIQQEIDALRQHVLTLPEPVPVYVIYLPCWVDEDGTTHFRPDHYRREQALAVQFPAR